jgi:hypothetical protein
LRPRFNRSVQLIACERSGGGFSRYLPLHWSLTGSLASSATRGEMAPTSMTTRVFKPTPEDRMKVEIGSGLGLPLDDIRRSICYPETGKAISIKVLKRRFPHELKNGPAKLRLQVGMKMLSRAMRDTSAVACMTLAQELLGMGKDELAEKAKEIVITGGLPSDEK